MTKRACYSVRLTVHQARLDEVYKDIVRIPENHRGTLRAGKVHLFKPKLVSKGVPSARFILRGLDQSMLPASCSYAAANAIILLDDVARDRLGGLKLKTEYEFKITECGFLGEMLWSLSATDPSYRIAARLGVISFVLAILATPASIRDWALWIWGLISWLYAN